MATGLLFSQMEPPAGWEADFHDWYENEHIPQRMELPGFDSAWRYEAIDGKPRYLACYFIDDMSIVESPAYRRLKEKPGPRTDRMLDNVFGFTRYLCDQISDTGDVADDDVRALAVVAFAVPSDAEERFEDWYQGEHVGMLMQADGWLRIRRYRVRPGGAGPAWSHLALHELRDAAVMNSPERQAAREAPKRAQLAKEPWFARSGRWLYRPIHVAHAVARVKD